MTAIDVAAGGRIAIENVTVDDLTPIDDVVPHPENPNTGDLAGIRESIIAHGIYRRLVVQEATPDGERRMRVIAGNHTRFVAKELGYRALPMEFVRCTDARALKIVLADNRTRDRATYDNDLLGAALRAAMEDDPLEGLVGTGWDVDAVNAILGGGPSPDDDGTTRDAPDRNYGIIAEKFLFGPFTVLDGRSGEWQTRKRAWIATGIKGELGRDVKAYNISAWIKENELSGDVHGGMSVFDPVLCELAYRWFCGHGTVVDPFAGGSVRGIVAAMLGLDYWGVDLRAEQVEANRAQAALICGTAADEPATVPVTISGPMLRQQFHPCEANFIKGTCRGRCCESTKGISVAVHPSETARIEALGARVENGYIVPDERGLCPFKTDEGFCGQHGPQKPFGCQASPFTLNDKGLMVVRNRYRRLVCYACEGALPAYEAHRWSLGQIFGDAEADRIAALAASGADRIDATMPAAHYRILADNHAMRNGGAVATATPPDCGAITWIHGDALDALPTAAPRADLVFSCPPYGDLETYSDDPRDLSNMDWPAFVTAYRRIIAMAVDRLNDDRFACFVVGDIRDARGFYRDFVSLTIAAFEAAGARLYNEAILVTPVASAAMRVTRQFETSRKMAKVHQNVLVFCKGDPRRATEYVAAAPVRTPTLPDVPDVPDPVT